MKRKNLFNEIQNALNELQSSLDSSGTLPSPSTAMVTALKKHGKLLSLLCEQLNLSINELAKSSRRLEFLTIALIFLTVFLAIIEVITLLGI